MLRAFLAALVVLTGCTSQAYKDWIKENAKFATTREPGSTSAGESTGGDTSNSDADPEVTSSSGADTTGGSDTTTDPGDASDTGQAPPIEEPEGPPHIVSVELPAKVYAAGPVALTVHTEHTTSVRIRLDDVEAGELAAAGDGRFVGELSVRGAIDKGWHEVEIIAKRGIYQDIEPAAYEVSTPEPGTMAWFKAGPAGSRTARLAPAIGGDLLEGGEVMINKTPRPNLRKRSGLDGAELWSVTLDTREGSVVDLSVVPDGRVWVAMNVREPGAPSPQPRIALFDAAGKFTGIEAFGEVGQEVRGIAADPDGGCFAAGFAVAGSDLDVGYWRVDGDGLQAFGNTWDYVPYDKDEHLFSDFATDVVITNGIAWVIGASHGPHIMPAIKKTLGMLVPIDLNTGKVLTQMIIKPQDEKYNQSMFFAAALHPEGVLVTGYGCDGTCTNYRIETSLIDDAGKRLWHRWDAEGEGLRSGRDVALDSQGRVIVGASVTQSGSLRGYVFASVVHDDADPPSFEHWFPGPAKPSEVLGVLVTAHDRLFAAGFVTVNGGSQSRVTLIHN